MKILHITATHLNKAGGIPVVLENLVKHQNKIDHVQAQVLSVRHDIKNIESDFFFYRKNFSDVCEFILNYEPEIVIFHGAYFYEYVKISKHLKEIGFEYYIEPHSSFGKEAQKKGRVKKIIANRTVFKNFIISAFGYIFLNEHEKNNSIFHTNNDLIIPNGIEEDLSIGVEKNLNNKVRLYFIGRIDINHKGLDILFKELKKLDVEEQDFEIRIYGKGSDKETKMLNHMIKEFNKIKVLYEGPIFDEAKKRMLVESNIMILTSRYEGFPMTVLEALAFGNPCIVTDGTNVREIVEKNNLGWGTDYKDISKTIKRAIVDYKKNMDHYTKNTRKYVLSNYLWTTIASDSINLLMKSQKDNYKKQMR
ncbi:glycosyltransferase [Globicatella sulfidifaciens]|uniref:glycosyltransferase n=1 Tax=Globicatella sulfidifaciens TaxID=136093 RepID=UPI0028914249|nr:glycosyltransferase [Globicatella sulfidifaciens]MDT2767636.1 glycosyltransferase [Globicatella sulfidifaciens]